MGNADSTQVAKNRHETVIRIPNATPDIQAATLRAYFSKQWPVQHVVIHERTGYVVFKDAQTCRKAMKIPHFTIKQNVYFKFPCTATDFNAVLAKINKPAQPKTNSQSSNPQPTTSNVNTPSTSQSAPTVNNQSTGQRYSTTEESDELKSKLQKLKEESAELDRQIQSMIKVQQLEEELFQLNAKNQALSNNLSELAIENSELLDEKKVLMEENESYSLVIKEYEQNSGQSSSQQQRFEECCVCLENRANCAIYKCGHVCLCDGCSANWQTTVTFCPVCRQKTESILKLYF